MAPTQFSILLDNPSGSFFPGQVITGKVILVMDQEKNTQGLKLKFHGEAEVGWQESHGQGGSKGYHSSESYFHTKLVLLGDDKNSDVCVPAGHQEYPFTFQLPLTLPSSFEGEFGHCRYSIEAVVKRSWKFDYNAKIMFTVNALVDLNLQPGYAEPREVSKEKSICCLCCKEGPISMKVEMPRTGYVPGDHVKFSVYSSNSSSRQVSAIVAYFVREISFHAQGRSRSTSQEIIKLRGPEIPPFQSESWQNQFQIPPVPPSNLGGCKIIEMTYLVKFKLDIPSSIDLKKRVPILIGTIPFTNFLSDLHQQHQTIPQPLHVPNGGNQEAQVVPSAPPIPLFSQYPSMPLPVYQDASVFGNDVEDNKSDNLPSISQDAGVLPPVPVPGDPEYRYVPKYATYHYGWNFHGNGTTAAENGING